MWHSGTSGNVYECNKEERAVDGGNEGGGGKSRSRSTTTPAYARSFRRRHGHVAVPITLGGMRPGTGGSDLRLVALAVDVDRAMNADEG